MAFGCILGNSTAATYLRWARVDYFLFTPLNVATGQRCKNIAYPGDTISDQRVAWLADADQANYDWIIVHVGLNDVNTNPLEAPATALGRYQDLIDAVNGSKKVAAKIITSTMTPDKAYLISLHGAVNGETGYQKWLEMNRGYIGTGATPITDFDAYVNQHTADISDGAGSLAPDYDSGDLRHENDEARKVMARHWHAKLRTLGYFPEDPL